MMKPGLKKLYSGDFNVMSQEGQPDGSVVITLVKRGENKSYCFHVVDLYGADEEVLAHNVKPTAPPQWVKDRMEEAQGHGKPDQPVNKGNIL